MIQEKITVKIPTGLDFFAARNISSEMKNFSSIVTIYYKHYHINAKSMMHILSATIPSNTTLLITCDGNDEKDCISKLCQILSSEDSCTTDTNLHNDNNR